MADQKVITMVLKVDLQCCRCYKKIKKVLCKFQREIRDQVFDEKTNTIEITVVCCFPEKIKQKIICKAGDTLKSIEIKEKPKAEKPKTPKEEKPRPVPRCYQPPAFPTCCSDCYHGNPGGPCYRGNCGPPPKCYQYDCYCWRSVYYSCGGGTYCANKNPCGTCCTNENPCGTCCANKNPCGTCCANENPCGTCCANKNPCGTCCANENPCGTYCANENLGACSIM